jgi:hypothetical protein
VSVICGLMVATVAGQQRRTNDRAKLDGPPQILNLGSNTEDGSLTVSCDGKEPFTKLSCHVYRLSIVRPSPEDHRKSRAELEKELSSKTAEQLLKQQQAVCANERSAEAKVLPQIGNYSAGRAASARHAFEQLKAVCSCATKECITAAMLRQQMGEQNECTIYNGVFPAEFLRVNDRKWVSNNGPEGLCGVVSIFTIEHEPTSAILWTYTSHITYTNNTQGFCKGLKDENATFSWQSGSSIRPACEEFKFSTLPESR